MSKSDGFGASTAVVADLHASIPAKRASLPQMRSLAGRFLDEHDVCDDVFYDALLVAHELVANAIEHGSGKEDEVEFLIQLRAHRLCIVVYDNVPVRGSTPVLQRGLK